MTQTVLTHTTVLLNEAVDELLQATAGAEVAIRAVQGCEQGVAREQQRQRELDEREAALNRREAEMLSEQRRSQIENATIARKLDERSSAFVNNLKEVESLGRERVKAEQDMLLALDAALQRAQAAEGNNETAAAITYAEIGRAHV